MGSEFPWAGEGIFPKLGLDDFRRTFCRKLHLTWLDKCCEVDGRFRYSSAAGDIRELRREVVVLVCVAPQGGRGGGPLRGYFWTGLGE